MSIRNVGVVRLTALGALGIAALYAGRSVTRGATMRFKSIITVALCLAAVVPARAFAAAPVHGSWQQLANCLFTHYDPLGGGFGCEGSSVWQGTWTGVTVYHAEGTYDVLSGDSAGRLQETFRGHDVDGRRGTISFDESYVLVGSTSMIHIDARIAGATGGFAGARGAVTFDGTDNVATGFGTYAGRWSPPPLPSRRSHRRSTSGWRP
jgi:hypothetical protein